jgi:hypothetical protein
LFYLFARASAADLYVGEVAASVAADAGAENESFFGYFGHVVRG